MKYLSHIDKFGTIRKAIKKEKQWCFFFLSSFIRFGDIAHFIIAKISVNSVKIPKLRANIEKTLENPIYLYYMTHLFVFVCY